VNHLPGQLPDLSHLRNLEVLDLSSDSLQGIIPDTLTNCSNLRELVLSYNLIEGEILLEVGHLSKLSTLRLSSNSLTGIIPPTLNNTQLQKIAIADNMLTGSIPDELGYLSNMSVLLLVDNMLSGEFPAALLNIPSLEMLDLGGNMLHRTLLTLLAMRSQILVCLC
jgi:Leucine-rich repeat (LRR) protein